MPPTFSIIVPTYNRGYTIYKTLQSIEAQTFKDFEVIVVDDGSTDDTQKVISPFLDDERFCIIKKDNEGVSLARELGMKRAKGDILTFIDSDDSVFDDYLQVAFDVFNQNQSINYCLSNCHFYVELVSSDNKILSTKHIITHESTVTLNDVYHWRKRVALGTGLFLRQNAFHNKLKWNKALKAFEDLDFVMQLAILDSEGYHFILKPLFNYYQRYGSDGLCASMSYKDWSEAFKQLLAIHVNDPLLTEPEAYLNRIDKYSKRHQLFKQGLYIAPYLKYFPEHEILA